jgi:hypothetical protein
LYNSKAKFKKYDKLKKLREKMGEKMTYEVDTETASDYLNIFVNKNKGFRAKISEDYGKRNKIINDNGFMTKKVKKSNINNKSDFY